MKKNKDSEGRPFSAADQLPEKNPMDKNILFLVLGLFLLAINIFFSHRHTFKQHLPPGPNSIAERYVWIKGSPQMPAGLYLFTQQQLENDFSEIGSLLQTGASKEPDSVISALQFNGSGPEPVNLPPEVANIFFREIPINRADKNILTSLPGIGPVLAEKIVLRRIQHGYFRSKDELLHIAGIGPKKFAKLVDRITLD